MKTSICMSTYNKAQYLDRTLESIRKQDVPFEYELIVADDGSSDNTKSVCSKYDVDKYVWVGDNTSFRNPSTARNVAYREAIGEIIIAQSDDVVHSSRNVIEMLTSELKEGSFLIATVWNYNFERNERANGFNPYTGILNPRPFFFLGSLWRKDLYAIGGNDEEFQGPGYDDDWFGLCLMKGLDLYPVFHGEILGSHQHHARPKNVYGDIGPSRDLIARKMQRAESGQIKYEASGGSWEL